MLSMVTDMAQQCRIIESILSNCDWFFSEEEMQPLSNKKAYESLMDLTPTSEFTQTGAQSLLLSNLQVGSTEHLISGEGKIGRKPLSNGLSQSKISLSMGVTNNP